MDMPELKTFAERLRFARKRARMTQAQLAERVGVSQAIISQLETGAYDKTVYAAQLAFACDVPAAWLAAGKKVIDYRPVVVEKLNAEEEQPLKVMDWLEITKRGAGVTTFRYLFVGDSMTGQPHLPSGAILTVDETKPLDDGKIVLASIAGLPAVGVFSKTLGKSFIRPSNPQYPAQEIDANEVVGVVCGYQVNFP